MGKHGRNRKIKNFKNTQSRSELSPAGPEHAERTHSNKDTDGDKERHQGQSVTPTPGAGTQPPDQRERPPIATTDTQKPSEQPSMTRPTPREQRAWRDRCTLKIDAWAAFANTLSCIVAGVALWFVYGQLTAMRDQLDLMAADSNSTSVAMAHQLGTMKEQTNVMSRQVDVMGDQLNQMRTDSQLDSRAWVGFTLGTPKKIEDSKEVECEIRCVNSGKTPASTVIARHTLRVIKKGDDIGPVMEAIDTVPINDLASQGCLAPNVILLLSSSNHKVITKDIADGIADATLVVYICGKITYYDFFGKPHATRYCYSLDPKRNRMVAHSKYNDMD